jgi:hypothetical protein
VFPRLIIPGLISVILLAAAAVSAESPKVEDKSKADVEAEIARRQVEGFWQVDAILDQAVDNIATRYNLNDIQKAETAEMMNEGVKGFLDRHQDEIWPLIRDLAMLQRKGSSPDPDAAKRLGPKAATILREAREEIFRYNEEWREILTEDQKRVHDYDMREMTKTFQTMEQNFESWGKGEVASRSIFPQPRPMTDQPPTPPKPVDGDLPGGKPTEHAPKFISHLEAYLQKFIADYQLTDPQREAAQSILREISGRTAAFHKGHAEELDSIKDKIAKADSRDERRRLIMERRRVTRPLDDLFKEFKARLDQIPEKAQRERFEAMRKKAQRAPAIDGSRIQRDAAGAPRKRTSDAKESGSDGEEQSGEGQ